MVTINDFSPTIAHFLTQKYLHLVYLLTSSIVMLTTLDATKVTLPTLNVPGAAHGIHNIIVFVLQSTHWYSSAAETSYCMYI